MTEAIYATVNSLTTNPTNKKMTWQRVKLGEIASNIQTGPFGSQLHQSDYSENGTPVVMPKDLAEGKISEATIARVSADHVDRLSRHKIEPGDILYSRRGDVGRCAYAGSRESGWLCGTGCLRVTINTLLAYPKFIFYQLQTASSIGWVEKHAIGATMLNINTSILAEIPLLLPPLPEQRRIADILSAYDDLIENNRKQIKLLEETARRLYKEWFIDLRFPGHDHTPIINDIPDGWEEKTLGDIIDFEIGGGWGSDTPTNEEDAPGYVIRGTDINGITRGSVSTIPFRYHAKSNIASRILKHGDIIFEVSGGSRNEGVGKAILMTEPLLSYFNAPVICASFCKLMRLEKPELAHYLYESIRFWRSCGRIGEFEKKSASSIINYRWKDFLDQQSVRIPPDAVMSQYNDLIVPIYDKIINLSLGIEKNALMRDRLLPKLMNGEIEPLVKNCR